MRHGKPNAHYPADKDLKFGALREALEAEGDPVAGLGTVLKNMKHKVRLAKNISQ